MKKRKIKDAEEYWKPLIFDYLDKKQPRYYVSTRGRFKAYTHISSGTIIKGKLCHGYLALDIGIRSKDGSRIRKTFFCHKLVAETFVPNLDKKKKKKVIHLDYNKRNNVPGNLDWASNQEAIDHEKKNPRFQEARTVFTSKLVKRDVSFIKDLIARKVPNYIIADYFGISEMQMTRIARGDSWNEIKPKFSSKS